MKKIKLMSEKKVDEMRSLYSRVDGNEVFPTVYLQKLFNSH